MTDLQYAQAIANNVRADAWPRLPKSPDIGATWATSNRPLSPEEIVYVPLLDLESLDFG